MQTLQLFKGNEREALDNNAPTIVFVHANGYPPASYRLLLEPLTAWATIYTVEHRPLWDDTPAPDSFHWQGYADDLTATLDNAAIGPVWLLGHSMGAVTSMLLAKRRPDLVAGLIAMDPVLLPARLYWVSRLLGLFNKNTLPIVKRALGRPHDFQSFEAAFSFYRSKRVFQRLSDAALRDYVHAGHKPVSGHGVTLRWSGAWEACVYRSAPLIWSVLRKLDLPMLGIAGDQSDVLTASIVDKWQATVKQLSLHVLHGGHLIPLEQPERCAALIEDFILGQKVA